jgi:hypothetical protein
MKYHLVAATFAAVLAAAPAGAQVVAGYDVAGGNAGTMTIEGNWKNNFPIYGSVNPAVTRPGATPILVEADPDLILTLTLNNFGAPGTDVQMGGAVIDATTGVPEPATWAMMLIGFGAVGGVLRNNRKATLRHA